MAKRKGRSKSKGMKAGKASKRSKGKRKPKAKPKSNQVPLEILEKRLGKLNRIVAKRGGDAYQ